MRWLTMITIFRLIKIKEWVDKNDPGAILIPFSGVFENKLLDMNEAERGKYLEENKVTRWIRNQKREREFVSYAWHINERNKCERGEERGGANVKKLNVSPNPRKPENPKKVGFPYLVMHRVIY